MKPAKSTLRGVGETLGLAVLGCALGYGVFNFAATAKSRPHLESHDTQVVLAELQAPAAIITREGCPACAAAKELIAEKGYAVREIKIEDPQSYQTIERLGGAERVPVLAVEQGVVVGFSAELYNELLEHTAT